MKQINIKITDADGKAVDEFNIKRLSIMANARRLSMQVEIEKMDIDTQSKFQLYACAALACTLHDKDGKLCYPKEDGAIKISEEMDIDVFGILTSEFAAINPIETTLKAKKKRS